MELTYKNSFRVNILNLFINSIMIISIVYAVLELKNIFLFIELVAVFYAILFEIMMLIILYAGIRQLNPPEFLEFLENGYVQLFGFIFINLLLMDICLVSLVVGSIIIFYSICMFLFISYQTR